MRLVIALAILMMTGCATSNIRMSADMCREGHIASYTDEDFAMSCQTRSRYDIRTEGNGKVNVNLEAKSKEDFSNYGPGAYGRQIFSTVKK